MNSITAHTIVNGTRNLILQFNIVADGSGNYSDVKLLDLNDYAGEPAKVPDDFKVMKVSGMNGVGTSLKLFFGAKDGGPNRLFYESIVDRDFAQDWSDIGGLTTGQANTDLTVRISTVGFNADLDTISLTLWIKKKYKVVGS